MSGFSRRSFMQMLGLGGMALAVDASAPIPLFGSDESSSLIIPDVSLLKGHVVVQRKGLTERIPASDPIHSRYGPYGGYKAVARLTKTQVPGGGPLSSLREHRLMLPGDVLDGADPHVVYYQSSHELRKRFVEISRARLLEVPPELRSAATLVTVVESPILAIPRPDRGFDVYAYFRQGVRYSTAGLDTFNIYSETGEFPIDVPRGIDLELLMKMDREILSDADLLVADPRSWRPSGRSSSGLWLG